MFVQIFDVNAGACALIRTDDGKHIMVDCGTNADTGWEPAEYLRSLGVDKLDLLVITNFDEDHVRGYPKLRAMINIRQIHRNKSVTPQQIAQLKDPDVGPGPGVSSLIADLTEAFIHDAEKVAGGGFSYDVFNNTPSQVGLESNDLSLVMLARCNGCNILFPGDLESPGWEAMRERILPTLRTTHILVAPHHGRENGQWEGFVGNTDQLHWVIISDKGYTYDTQTKAVPFYRNLAKGWRFGEKNEQRFVLTTRNDGSIHLDITPQAVSAWCFDESY